jgi:precorrin-4 methylase
MIKKINLKLLRVAVLLFLLCFASISSVARPGRAGDVSNEEPGFYLVGMGPGDPELATVRALQTVKKADLFICTDRHKQRFADIIGRRDVMAVPAEVHIWHGYGKTEKDYDGFELEKFREAEKVRADVARKIRKAVKKGKTVVILDSGDPLIYGMWAWTLTEFKDLNPEVVPGLSCFNAAQALLKKDVTWTGLSKTTILTANDFASGQDTIANLSRNQATMVIYTMGLPLNELVDKLEIHYPPHTPIAIVFYAGYEDKQFAIYGSLSNIEYITRDMKIPFEHLVFVGRNLDFEWKEQ